MSTVDETADVAAAAAAAAQGCAVVAALDDGGLTATFLPGRRIGGVRVDDEVCEVAVVLTLGDAPLPELAEQVRRAVVPVVGGRRVDVLVADVVAPEPAPPAAPVADR